MGTNKEVILISLLGLVLVLGATWIHYQSLRLINTYLPRLKVVPGRTRVMIAVVGALVSHLVHMVLFAVAYYTMDRYSAGAIDATTGGRTFIEFMYFSAETYTSLGLGDIFPLGMMRLIVGIESITGLVLIGWTASFTYLEMRRYWETGVEPPGRRE